MTAQTTSAAVGRVTLGHLALHYGRPEDAAAAARLLETFGFVREQTIPLPDGATFYHFVIDGAATNNGDGIVYLSAAPPAQRDLTAAIRLALKVGQEDEHPTVGAFRAALAQDPEYTFHLGVLFQSLEQIEAIVETLSRLERQDPDFKGRLKITVNRAMPGTPEIDARMDASPVFRGVARHPYGRHAIQAFVETDLLSAGPLGESLVIEMDYVFPGYPENLFTKTVL
jgi:hypothetical protein